MHDGVRAGLIDLQNEYGYTALMLACFNDWDGGIHYLLKAEADTELRVCRTGCTILYECAQQKKLEIAKLLLAAGADPDAENCYGITPRHWQPKLFEHLPVTDSPLPEPRIQNADHLADHHWPNFEIPSMGERCTLAVDRAVILYVYGPKLPGKTDQLKVRIISRSGSSHATRFVGRVETPIDQTHLLPGTDLVEFGPENVASIFYPKSLE